MVGDSMNERRERENIEQALKDFQQGALVMNARNLLNALGYKSELTIDFESSLAEEFISYFDQFGKLNRERAMVDEWESIDFLFQLTEEEISGTGETRIAFKNRQFDDTIIESYVFFAVTLKESHYTRTQLSTITREINKLMQMPAMILFQHGQTLSLAVIDRRLHKRDEAKDVLEKVTLIKDIHSHDPHPAHIQILFDLSRNELFRVHGFSNFVELHRAWAKTLDIQELNKRFYRELSNWYFWAMNNVTFPDDAGEDVEIRNATSIIRLITRLIFVWFIKERKLIPDIFFNPREIEKILISTAPQESTYYKAILQNLVVATVNQEMNTSEKLDNRKCRGKGRQHYNITCFYRYREDFTEPDDTLEQFWKIPFLNGGLFECLDKEDKDDPKKILRIDGFSDRADNQVSVPNFLFLSDEIDVDLNAAYGTKNKRYKVRGLIEILRRYKFTITENTPIEEEVALDPELLGNVFENLLAAYNPETRSTAREETGSFYTPREVVNYMVDESLIAYLKSKLITYYETESTFSTTSPPSQLDLSGQAEPSQTELDTPDVMLSDEKKADIEKRLRHLIAYNNEPHKFNESETEQLIKAVDTLKILDPACGSGAFPMGILHKLVLVLGKLDPDNGQWKRRQITRVETLIEMAEKIDDSTVRRNTIRSLKREIDNINEAFERNELDYGRKLYLIENCIYGVDIQPIAVQISKLRFFVSLVVDQKIDNSRENKGVRPLPNLETKFVAANALLGITGQLSLRSSEVIKKEKELNEVRRRYFTARTPRTKEKYRKRDAKLRGKISELLNSLGLPSGTAQEIASWDPYNQNATADWFDREWMFGLTDGFDVVIGNPPYKQVRKGIHSSIQFPYSEGMDKGKQNLYKLFVEQSYNLCKEHGLATLIVQSSLMCDLSSAATRQLLLEHTQLKHIIEFPKKAKSKEAQVFDAVTQGTCIYQFTKATPDGKPIGISVGNDAHSIANLNFASITKDAIFTLYPGLYCFPHIKKGSVSILEKIASDKTIKPLGNYAVDIVQGDLNLTNDAARFSGNLTPVLLLRGKHVARFAVKYANATEYCEEEFMTDKIDRNHREIFLICQQVTGTVDPRRLHFALTANSPISFLWGNSVNKVLLKNQADSWAYLALLNSKFMDWYFRITSTNNHVQGYELEHLPIPAMSDDELKRLDRLAKRVMEAKAADPGANTTDREKEIDDLVYVLYGLTSKEIAIVEELEG